MTTSDFKARFLEIGPGAHPSAYRDIDDDDFLYVAVDLPRLFTAFEEMRALPSAVFTNEWEGKSPFGKYTQADARLLPFRSGSFDMVVMHGVAGQIFEYETNRSIEGTPTMQCIAMEAFRVLRPDGRFVVFEDNTPMDIDMLVRSVMPNGFHNANLIVSDKHPEAYLKAFTHFYPERDSELHPDDPDVPYVMSFSKSGERQGVKEVQEVYPVDLNHYRRQQHIYEAVVAIHQSVSAGMSSEDAEIASQKLPLVGYTPNVRKMTFTRGVPKKADANKKVETDTKAPGPELG